MKKFTNRDLLHGLVEGLVQGGVNNFYSYKPHAKQLAFHSSDSKKKQYIGGNRSGKTVGGVLEDIYWLKRDHPFRPLPVAESTKVQGRVVTTDFDDGLLKIILPKFQEWTPPSLLINGSWEDSYERQTKTLRCSNGSICDFMTYKQQTEDFAGVGRHFTHFDEEPPRHIYEECAARLIDFNGSWWATMTPVEGMTWTYDEWFENPDIFKVVVDMIDNPYISEEAVENYLSGLDEDTKKMRKSGVYIQSTGLIFKTFDPKIHTIDPIPSIKHLRDWRLVCSMDSGINHPTVFLWHLVSANNTVITFREHHRKDWTVAQHSERVKEICEEIGRWPDLITGDPAIKQRQVATGVSVQLEYRRNGIAIKPPTVNMFEAGILRMMGYLNTDPPHWYISRDCPNLIREMQRYRWAPWESKKLQQTNAPKRNPHKKDDDAVDAARYFFIFQPELRPGARGDTIRELGLGKYIGATEKLVLVNPKGIRRIPSEPRSSSKTEWSSIIDEHLGGDY